MGWVIVIGLLLVLTVVTVLMVRKRSRRQAYGSDLDVSGDAVDAVVAVVEIAASVLED